MITSIDLFVDARNVGEWSRCVKLTNLTLPSGWLQHAHVGMSASTGQLADNHDVISFQAYSEAYVMETELMSSKYATFPVPDTLMIPSGADTRNTTRSGRTYQRTIEFSSKLFLG